MSIKRGRICRLCLNVTQNKFEEIDGLTMQILDVLMLNLDLDTSRDPIICQDCMEVAKKCLNFKFTCIRTEKSILSFSIGRGVIPNIKIIYKEVERREAVVDADLDICRFCLNRLEKNNFVLLETLMDEARVEMLSAYMPEMIFNTKEDPIICTTCKDNLKDYFKFVLNCRDVQGKIIEYCEEEGMDSMGRVNLEKVNLSFHAVSVYPRDCPPICKIKHESDIFEDIEYVYPEANNELLQLEEVDIKEEEINLDKESYRNCSVIRSDKHLSKIKMYQCSSCSYKSKQKSYLKYHMLVHQDDLEIRMYKCPLCSYEAKRKPYLNKHMLVHKDLSEIKMHKCSSCVYESKCKSALNRHMLVHKDVSELKMFKCSLCAYEGKQKVQLMRHMLVHKDISEIKMQKCSLCGFESKHKKALRRICWFIETLQN